MTNVVVRLAADGSRRVVDHNTIQLGIPLAVTLGQLARDFWRRRTGLTLPSCFWGLEWGSDPRCKAPCIAPLAARDGWYLPYPPADGVAVYPVFEPVNQVPLLSLYQRNAAVSAHDLQVTLGTDVMQSATDDDYQTVKHSFIHLIGAAWQRYVEWATVDPEELIVGGNYDGTLLWRRYLDDHAATDEALCGTCDIANFARRFYFHANLPLFRQAAPERDNLQR